MKRFALIGIDAQITELRRRREELLGDTSVKSSSVPTKSIASSPAASPRKRKKMTAEHRAKLKAAAKLRWEKARAAKK